MAKKYYAQTNPYGSETDRGFRNTMEIVTFPSAARRDAWVSANEDYNMAICALTARQARRVVATACDESR